VLCLFFMKMYICGNFNSLNRLPVPILFVSMEGIIVL